jgi:uncharacterized membrane protein
MKKVLNFLLSRNGIILILVVMTIVGFLIRYPLVSKTDFWSDEAFTGTVLREDWGTMAAILIEDKVHPPIYYVLIKLWGLAFGYQDTTLRNFSLVFGVLLIPVTYWFASLLDKNQRKARLIGLVAALLATFSPYFIVYSVENRSYSMLMVLGAICAISFYKAITTSPKKFNRLWLLTIILILSTFLVHYLAIIHVALYVIVYLVYRLLDNGTLSKPAFWKKLLLITTGGYIVALWLSNTSFVARVIGQLKNRMAWIPNSSLVDSIKSVYAFLFGVDRQATGVPPVLENHIPVQYMTIAVVVFLLIIASTAYYIHKNRQDKAEVFKMLYFLILSFGGLVFTALCSDFSINMYVERYMSIYGWFLIILIAYLAIKVWGKYSFLVFGLYAVMLTQVVYPPTNHIYSSTGKYIDQKMQAKHVFACDATTTIIMNNYLENYRTRLIMYAPIKYNLFSKARIYATNLGVKKDFNDAVSGDAYICPERKDDNNRTFLEDVEGMKIYKIN